MIVWICTDMEGLAGIDSWDQCYHPDDNSPEYRHGREQLTADANAAIAGCFDAGAKEVRILDGHGRNRNRGFLEDRLDRRATRVWVSGHSPVRWEGLDEQVSAVAVIGQHARAATVGGFLDHTQCPKEVCRYAINGCDHGEIGQMALYAGVFGVPLVYVSGDEAACAEAQALFGNVTVTPTKRGIRWDTCELYDPPSVRQNIRRDICHALQNLSACRPWRPRPPVTISVEWAWTGAADGLASVPGVKRTGPRTVEWELHNPLDIFTWPSERWSPAGSTA